MDGEFAVMAAQQHVPAIQSWVWARCAMSSREGDDIVQECLIEAWKQGQRGRFPVDKAAQLEWMRRVALCAIVHRRRGLASKAEKLVDDDDLDGFELPNGAVDEQYEEADAARGVREALAELACHDPKLYRAAVCRWIDELDVKDIARICRVPENTAWNRLRLARKQLAEILARREACEAGQLQRAIHARRPRCST